MKNDTIKELRRQLRRTRQALTEETARANAIELRISDVLIRVEDSKREIEELKKMNERGREEVRILSFSLSGANDNRARAAKILSEGKAKARDLNRSNQNNKGDIALALVFAAEDAMVILS